METGGEHCDVDEGKLTIVSQSLFDSLNLEDDVIVTAEQNETQGGNEDGLECPPPPSPSLSPPRSGSRRRQLRVQRSLDLIKEARLAVDERDKQTKGPALNNPQRWSSGYIPTFFHGKRRSHTTTSAYSSTSSARRLHASVQLPTGRKMVPETSRGFVTPASLSQRRSRQDRVSRELSFLSSVPKAKGAEYDSALQQLHDGLDNVILKQNEELAVWVQHFADIQKYWGQRRPHAKVSTIEDFGADLKVFTESICSNMQSAEKKLAEAVEEKETLKQCIAAENARQSSRESNYVREITASESEKSKLATKVEALSREKAQLQEKVAEVVEKEAAISELLVAFGSNVSEGNGPEQLERCREKFEYMQHRTNSLEMLVEDLKASNLDLISRLSSEKKSWESKQCDLVKAMQAKDDQTGEILAQYDELLEKVQEAEQRLLTQSKSCSSLQEQISKFHSMRASAKDNKEKVKHLEDELQTQKMCYEEKLQEQEYTISTLKDQISVEQGHALHSPSNRTFVQKVEYFNDFGLGNVSQPGSPTSDCGSPSLVKGLAARASLEKRRHVKLGLEFKEQISEATFVLKNEFETRMERYKSRISELESELEAKTSLLSTKGDSSEQALNVDQVHSVSFFPEEWEKQLVCMCTGTEGQPASKFLDVSDKMAASLHTQSQNATHRLDQQVRRTLDHLNSLIQTFEEDVLGQWTDTSPQDPIQSEKRTSLQIEMVACIHKMQVMLQAASLAREVQNSSSGLLSHISCQMAKIETEEGELASQGKDAKINQALYESWEHVLREARTFSAYFSELDVLNGHQWERSLSAILPQKHTCEASITSNRETADPNPRLSEGLGRRVLRDKNQSTAKDLETCTKPISIGPISDSPWRPRKSYNTMENNKFMIFSPGRPFHPGERAANLQLGQPSLKDILGPKSPSHDDIKELVEEVSAALHF